MFKHCSSTPRVLTHHLEGPAADERSPEHIAWCGQIRAIPFKKTTTAVIPYLDKPEMNTLLAAPDRRRPKGDVITLSYCSSTTPEPALTRRPSCRLGPSLCFFVCADHRQRRKRAPMPLWRLP